MGKIRLNAASFYKDPSSYIARPIVSETAVVRLYTSAGLKRLALAPTCATSPVEYTLTADEADIGTWGKLERVAAPYSAIRSAPLRAAIDSGLASSPGIPGSNEDFDDLIAVVGGWRKPGGTTKWVLMPLTLLEALAGIGSAAAVEAELFRFGAVEVLAPNTSVQDTPAGLKSDDVVLAAPISIDSAGKRTGFYGGRACLKAEGAICSEVFALSSSLGPLSAGAAKVDQPFAGLNAARALVYGLCTGAARLDDRMELSFRRMGGAAAILSGLLGTSVEEIEEAAPVHVALAACRAVGRVVKGHACAPEPKALGPARHAHRQCQLGATRTRAQESTVTESVARAARVRDHAFDYIGLASTIAPPPAAIRVWVFFYGAPLEPREAG
ncbi:unnamed protein product [Prorocentrum cordatum]|uniref:Uncharacterized protein n=1 Tax=Prorocentrum cordatum TaxID=2364126 RepID=A0ABN9YGG1_9DINO|nr:unnamed protein product [Polarella glacialis]